MAVWPLGSRRSQRKRRRFILAGSALAAIVVALAALMIFRTIDQREAIDTPAAEPPTATAAMGKPLRDGQIEFLVESIRSLEVSPGPPPVSVQVATVRITNRGSSSHRVAIDDQVVIDDHGHTHHADPLISDNLNDDQDVVSLEPGATTTMRIPVNVAPDAQPTAAVLHAGPFTPGVEVALTK